MLYNLGFIKSPLLFWFTYFVFPYYEDKYLLGLIYKY